MVNQLLVSPSGTLTSVPSEEVAAAIQDGFSKAPAPIANQVLAVSPSGVLTSLSHEEKDAAFSDGFKPFDELLQHHQKIQETASAIDTGKIPLVGNDSTYGPLDMFKQSAGGTKPPPSNPSLQDAAGNYKLVIDGKPQDVSPDRVAGTLVQNPNAKFADPQAQLVYEAFLQNNTSAQHYGGGAVGGAFPGMIEGGNKAIFSDPATRSGAKLQILAEQVAAETRFKTEENIGQIGGAIASLPLTRGGGTAGGIAEKAIATEGAGALQKAAGFVANKAIEGAVTMLPQATATAIVDKDPKLAGEQLLLGAGLGIGLGAIGKGAGAILGKLERPVVSEIDQAITKEAGATAGKEEVENAFRKSLIENGLGEKSTVKEGETIINKLAAGEHMTSALGKLDPYLETKLPASALQNKIAELGESFKAVDSKVAPAVDVLANNVGNLADKNGNISLQNIQKAISEMGDVSGESSINAFRQQAKQLITKEMIDVGNIAATKADAKTVAEWANAKAVANVASSIKSDLGVTNAFSPIFKLLKSFAIHKAAHLAVGAAIGGVAGGHEHGVEGALAGAAAGLGSKQIVHWIEKYASNPENASKISKWLYGKSTSSSAASYLIIDAAHAANQNLQKVAPFIEQIGTKGGATFATKESPVKQILGTGADGLSKEQQFTKLSQQITNLASNPGVKEQHLNSLMAPIADVHPGLAEQMKQDYDNKIQYLHQIMPKNPNPPQPFMKDDKWKPTSSDLAEFDNHLKIAQNPFVLLDKLKDGKVTPKEVATASMLNPAILNHIRDQIAVAAYSGKANLTYQQRLAASVVMGQAMDASLNNTQQLQSVYGPTMQASAPVPKQNRGSTKGLANVDKIPQAKETLGQRLMGK